MFLIFLSFFFFDPDNKCYKQKWGVLFFTCIKLVAGVLVFVWDHMQWERQYISFDTLEQCLATSRGKISKQILETQIWANRAKIRHNIRFFAIFSSLLH